MSDDAVRDGNLLEDDLSCLSQKYKADDYHAKCIGGHWRERVQKYIVVSGSETELIG